MAQVRTAEDIDDYLREGEADPDWETASDYVNDYDPDAEIEYESSDDEVPRPELGPVVSPPRTSKAKPKKSKEAAEAARKELLEKRTSTATAFVHNNLTSSRYAVAVSKMKSPRNPIEARHLAKVVQKVGKLTRMRPSEVRAQGIPANRIPHEIIAAWLGRDRKWVAAAYEAYPLQGVHGPHGRRPHPAIVELLTTNANDKAYGIETYLQRLQRARLWLDAEDEKKGVPVVPQKRGKADTRKPGRRTKARVLFG